MNFFLDDHREDSSLTGELPEESDQFFFLRAACLDNLQGSVGLVLVKISTMRISRDSLDVHYRCLYENLPDPTVFMTVLVVNTSGRLYYDFFLG
jgi:hypothetical protein